MISALLLVSLLTLEADPPRPNVVLIMADDMGYECVASNGGESYRTPTLDRIAREGLRFTQCYSTPLCTPSRVQIMTGRYNHRNYVRFGYLDRSEKTFGNFFRDEGYATCIVGKWQLTYGDFDSQRPKHFGFDEWCLWNTTKKKPPRYANPGLDVNGENRTFPGKYGPDVVSDHGMAFMEKNKDRPFFLYYPMILPHSPFVRTPKSGDGKKTKQAYFADMIEYTDLIVGRIIAKLEELEIAERTLVIFTGDNGTHRRLTSRWLGQDYPGGKAMMSVSGTHVPMFVYWKGKVSPGENHDLIDFTDFVPTLCQAAGISPPESIEFDGQSFLPRILGKETSSRESIFCHYDPRWNVPEKPGRFASTARYKLYHHGALFDIANDWREQNPLPDSEEFEAIRAKLQAVLDSKPAWTPPEKSRRAPPKR